MKDPLVPIFLLFLMMCVLLAIVFVQSNEIDATKARAVSLGNAEYNSTNGNWQWIDHSQK